METVVDEVADNIFRLSTYVQPANFTFNQYLVRADEPLLFHCGPRAMFPLISAAMAKVVPVAKLRWVSFGHHESDESGSMNEWLAAAPQAQVAVGEIGCMISMNDLAARPPKALADGATLDLGGKLWRQPNVNALPVGGKLSRCFFKAPNNRVDALAACAVLRCCVHRPHAIHEHAARDLDGIDGQPA